MAYEPTNWKAGDTVTSAKLNKLEQGVASAGDGGVLIVSVDETMTLDKTWKEIHDALANGTIVVFSDSDETGVNLNIVNEASVEEETYHIYVLGSETLSFITDSENGYPTMGDQK